MNKIDLAIQAVQDRQNVFSTIYYNVFTRVYTVYTDLLANKTLICQVGNNIFSERDCSALQVKEKVTSKVYVSVTT